MRFSEDYLREVKDRNDIISVAGEYVTLKRSGNTYSCCCPFHSEKTPSCHFYTNDPHFYCFGCHKGGDVITFVMEAERLTYPEAVKFLAERAGMPLPEDNGNDVSGTKRLRIYEMNRAAGKFFHEQLFSPEGKAGLDYLTNRGLSIHTIKRFGLGFAANDWHKLQMYMRGLGYSDFEMVDASLLANNNNKMYDKFRNRVMFPIFDTRGNVAGFGGRTLDEKSNPPKYLNSGETPVFHKSDMLYAMNIAKNSKADHFILCEGYMDVIAMHQAGFDSAVASLGTALTQQHVNSISRLGKKRVILSYDSDAAGQNAASKAINLFSKVNMEVSMLKMDGAKDPDEYIRSFGRDSFEGLIESSGSALDFELDKLANGLNLAEANGVSMYLKKAVPFLAGLTSDIERAAYIGKVSKQTNTPQQTLESLVNKQRGAERRRARAEEQKAFTRPRQDSINPDSLKLPREEKAERGIICFLYHNPEKLGMIQGALKNGFATGFNARVYGFLSKMCETGQAPALSAFNEEFNADEMGRISDIIRNNVCDYDENILRDNISALNRHFESTNAPPDGELSDEELLELAKSLKEKK